MRTHKNQKIRLRVREINEALSPAKLECWLTHSVSTSRIRSSTYIMYVDIIADALIIVYIHPKRRWCQNREVLLNRICKFSMLLLLPVCHSMQFQCSCACTEPMEGDCKRKERERDKRSEMERMVECQMEKHVYIFVQIGFQAEKNHFIEVITKRFVLYQVHCVCVYAAHECICWDQSRLMQLVHDSIHIIS